MKEIEKEAEEVLEKLSKSLEKARAATGEHKEVYYITGGSNATREDSVSEDKKEFREAAKKNAPKFKEGYFISEVGEWVK